MLQRMLPCALPLKHGFGPRTAPGIPESVRELRREGFRANRAIVCLLELPSVISRISFEQRAVPADPFERGELDCFGLD